MSLATTILTAAVTELAGLYPAIPVKARKEPMVREGDPAPLLLVSLGDGETVEEIWAGEVLVTYPLRIVYAIASVPPGWDEVPDVRDKREAIRQRILGAARDWDAAVNDCWAKPGPPYKLAGDRYHTYSVIVFDIETLETRTG
jgi:hypothetical protein